MAQVKLMQNQKQMSAIIHDLCKRALDGELNLENFYELWPEEASHNLFLKQIYEDIEDGVQHLPGTWRTGKMLSNEWYKSDMYFTIYLDFLLLDYDVKKTDELIQCRKFILEQRNLSVEMIKDGIKQCFKR